MTRKSKLEPCKQPRKVGHVIDLTDDENFNWLHSMTPENRGRTGSRAGKLVREYNSVAFTPAMHLFVTSGTERDQVILGVPSTLASKPAVMDL